MGGDVFVFFLDLCRKRFAHECWFHANHDVCKVGNCSALPLSDFFFFFTFQTCHTALLTCLKELLLIKQVQVIHMGCKTFDSLLSFMEILFFD